MDYSLKAILRATFPIATPLSTRIMCLETAERQVIQKIAASCLTAVGAIFICLSIVGMYFVCRSIRLLGSTKETAIFFIDRETKIIKREKVVGESTLQFLYGDDLISRIFGAALLHLLVRVPLFSCLYGWHQKSSCSKSKIVPFVRDFEIDMSQFKEKIDSFSNFNDFFVRKVKPEMRPIAPGYTVAVMPSDGRYSFYKDIKLEDDFTIKGQKFNLAKFLNNQTLAKEFEHGTMVIARLCPTDYHRFHFPVACIPEQSDVINGWLYSVNPIAMLWAAKHNMTIFTENKRTFTQLASPHFGKVLSVEIGASTIGSINQTYETDMPQQKGAEKGYFSFGGSTIVLLFKKGAIELANDLQAQSQKAQLQEHQLQDIEIFCKMGQVLGKVPSNAQTIAD